MTANMMRAKISIIAATTSSGAFNPTIVRELVRISVPVVRLLTRNDLESRTPMDDRSCDVYHLKEARLVVFLVRVLY